GPHTWQSDQLKFDSKNVNGGESKTITFAAKPGSYDFYCLYHKSLGMVGKMVIQ
ncbi:MAG: cupredoxin domain-containing protein, partial [Mycobacteriales bacterium]